MTSAIGLLRSRRFLPLLLTQILGAASENLAKSSFLMVLAFGSDLSADGLAIFSAAAGACLMAPSMVLSGIAGELADRFERAMLLRILKVAELLTIIFVIWALMTDSTTLSLVALLAIGTQAAFGGPVKYALLPQLLSKRDLIEGNALMESGTFLAILGGTLAGGFATVFTDGLVLVAVVLVVLGTLGVIASLFVPEAFAPAPKLRITPNPLRSTLDVLVRTRANATVWNSILGTSWFWLVGSITLSQLPAYAKASLGVDEGVVTLFLVLFSLGVAVGSLACGKVMGQQIDARLSPPAALVMALALADLWAATSGFHAATDRVLTVDRFLARAGGVRLCLDLTLLAAGGGAFVVPLYALIQSRAALAEQARSIAANNIVNAIFMTLAGLVASGLFAAGMAMPDMFLILAVLTVVVMLQAMRLMPAIMLKAGFRVWFGIAYRAKVEGLENYPADAPRVLIVANHTSYIDGALLAAFLPGQPMFAVNSLVAQKWWARIFLSAVDIFPIDPTKPMATKALIKAIRDTNRHCVIFPEGRLNTTGGSLMKVYPGPGLIADRTDAVIVPVRILGPEITPFSKLGGTLRRHWFPRITITILPPETLDLPAGAQGRDRRRIAGTRLYDIMSSMMSKRPDANTVFEAFLDARDRFGRRSPIIEDPQRTPLNYDRVLLGALALGREFAGMTHPGEPVGVMLPNASATALTFLGLQLHGRVPAMINPTAGPDAALSACDTAGVRLVITSRRFIEIAKLRHLVERLEPHVAIVKLEDIRDSIGLGARLTALLSRPFARRIHRKAGAARDDAAVILFTSGSEGAPKGVVLSHGNLLANRRQIAARISFSPRDIVLNALPLFHSFGLSGGFLLPLLSGARIFLYPSPLHYRIVPEIAYDINATILFGTSTFLTGYAKCADAYDFHTVRYVIAGAERVQDQTRELWMDKFGIRILESYGVTECSPVIAACTPMHFKAGTVGRAMPEMETYLDPVPGIDRGGRLFVKGPNIMKGYLLPSAPGVLVPPPGGWHDTGDIVEIDADKFITILARAKRFAKLGGEMISLAVSEAIAAEADGSATHAVVSIPDAKKGERLVLVTTATALPPASLLAAARKLGAPELAIPKDIVVIDALPLLATGKLDYPVIARLAESRADKGGSHDEKEGLEEV